jgi:hypothetical protein
VHDWRADIYEMLSRIPSIHPMDMNYDFRSIESKLSFYESLQDSPALLELAIWKSKISELANMKKKRRTETVSRTQCRTDSLAMVMIIVPIVFSFLSDGSGGNDIAGDNDTNDGDGYDYNDTFDFDDNDSSDDGEDDGGDDGDHSEHNIGDEGL